MPHGGEDWGTVGPLGIVYTLEDMAELVVRLGSIDTFDRRGNVIWLDDFESGINKWVPGGSGAAPAVTWDSTRARNGDFSVKLLSGDVTGNTAYIYHQQPFPVLSKLGFEFSFSIGANVREIWLTASLTESDLYHIARIKWIAASKLFQYWGTGAPDLDLSPLVDFNINASLFNTVKLVVDPTLKKHVRLIANNTVFDMAGMDYHTIGGAYIPYLWMEVKVFTNKDAAATLYVDDVIITQNES